MKKFLLWLNPPKKIRDLDAEFNEAEKEAEFARLSYKNILALPDISSFRIKRKIKKRRKNELSLSIPGRRQRLLRG